MYKRYHKYTFNWTIKVSRLTSFDHLGQCAGAPVCKSHGD